jgi:hypothetical protein
MASVQGPFRVDGFSTALLGKAAALVVVVGFSAELSASARTRRLLPLCLTAAGSWFASLMRSILLCSAAVPAETSGATMFFSGTADGVTTGAGEDLLIAPAIEFAGKGSAVFVVAFSLGLLEAVSLTPTTLRCWYAKYPAAVKAAMIIAIT